MPQEVRIPRLTNPLVTVAVAYGKYFYHRFA